jgi:hypothetical protein
LLRIPAASVIVFTRQQQAVWISARLAYAGIIVPFNGNWFIKPNTAWFLRVDFFLIRLSALVGDGDGFSKCGF